MIIFEVESGDWYDMVGGKPTIELNIFYNYSVHEIHSGVQWILQLFCAHYNTNK